MNSTRRLALAFAVVVLASAAPVRAQEIADSLQTGESAARKALNELKNRWHYVPQVQAVNPDPVPPIFSSGYAPAEEKAGSPSAPKGETDVMNIVLEDPSGKALASMEMTRRTLNRYRYLYQEWAEDSKNLPPFSGVYKNDRNEESFSSDRLSEPYLGKAGGRDFLAIADVLLTASQREGTFVNYAVIDGAAETLLQMMKAVDAAQNHSIDIFGETEDVFRSGRAQIPPTGPVAAHTPRFRLRVHANQAFKHGYKKASVGVVFTDTINDQNMKDWHFMAAAENTLGGSKGKRVWIGLNGPWPDRH